MSDRPSGRAPAILKAVLGPTNTGKTHLAVERMLGHGTGMIGLPLRLLAREIYDRVVKARGAAAVALVTGEEKIIPPRARYWVATVEAMPLSIPVEFLAVDEIQLCADPERGHIFTHRLLHARGTAETMLLGAGTMGPLVRRLLPGAEISTRDRFSALAYDGPRKLTRLPKRSAIVAFSADNVYAIAELIRRQRGGAAVVMGSLSPRTRNAQVALYQSGEVDFLVATDAIGMGLNMDVDHVAFAGLRKFDGRRTRWLQAQEIGQIGGRAGRFRKDGTFGVTGDAPELDADLVEAVEQHRFDPVVGAEWRNSRLDFTTLASLQASLTEAPARAGLRLSAEALDERTLRHLAQDDEIRHRARGLTGVQRLWDACQTPDFRKTTLDEHLRLVGMLFRHLSGGGRVPDDWIAGQLKGLDHLTGDIDTLARRLAGVRTLAYVANRPNWLADPVHWQGRTRDLEDRLSDTLHERLMQRFIDRRTSALLRGLSADLDLSASMAGDGSVSVEGHAVGRLKGLDFAPERGSSALEDRALRSAAQRAVSPEIGRRLGRIAAEPDEAFALQPDGLVLWRGEAVGQTAGGTPFAPRVRLFGDLGGDAARERAHRRLEAFIAAEAGRSLEGLKRLQAALADGTLKGLPRGIAYRLAEAGGVIDRRAVETEVAALSQAERRTLRGLGVRLGAFSIYLPSVLTRAARDMALAFAPEAAGWRPPEGVSVLPVPVPSPRALAARGMRACGGLAVGVETLERLEPLLRAAPRVNGGAVLDDAARERLGWSAEQAAVILRGLGFTPANRPAAGEPQSWIRRANNRGGRPPAPAASPFGALAALAPAADAAPTKARRPARRRPKKPRRAGAA